MRHLLFNLWLLGFICTPIQGENRDAFPSFFAGDPPVNNLDCALRYFACTDDHTYGKWPMNSRICLRDYQVCIAQVKWNQKVDYRKGVKIISPINNPVYTSEKESGKYVKSRIFGYLYTFSFFKTLCTNNAAKLSCKGLGKIKIIFVFHGRIGREFCMDKFPQGYVHNDCIVEESDRTVYRECNGKNECMLPYLQVKYTCTGFRKPIVKSSGPLNSTFNEIAVIDQKINTIFSTRHVFYPWIHIMFPKPCAVAEVIVIANKGKHLVNIASIEVKLFNEKMGDDGNEIQIPYERSKKNIYVIYDKSCARELLAISCNVYGGNIEIIESIIGRTSGECDSLNPDLECSIRVTGILPSCLGKPVFQQATCKGINFYEIRYTCTGIPNPKITTSTVDNGFSFNFLLYEEEFPTNYFSSRFEDSPWIQISFGAVLAVVGVQMRVDLNEGSTTTFKNIEVRVGDISVRPPGEDQIYIVIKCGDNDNFLLGKHLTIHKRGTGVLKMRDVLVLLLPESNIKEVKHIGGFLIEDLFCDDFTSLTCKNSGGGTIVPVDAFAGSSVDPKVCNPKTNVVDIKTSCNILLTSIVRNNCLNQEICNIDLTRTETCPEPTHYRRILFRCSNFEDPMGRASSFESRDHDPKYALDGKIATGEKFLFKSDIEFGPWFEVNLKDLYIIKGLEVIFGDLNNIKRSVQVNVLRSPHVPDFFLGNGKRSNESFPEFRMDCLYRFFACSDDHTYGKWPMNARVCLRDYQVCTAERKWNQKETDYGRVKITRPIINPNHQTENGSYLTPRIVDYLYSFSCFDTICGNQRKKLSCGSNVKEVLVFAKKGEDYVELSNYEVKLSNIANFDFSTDRHNCIKKTKWDLTFLCGSANLYMGAMVYSTGIGIMAVKEVTFILIKDGGIDEDKSCSKELLDVSCESYGGNIEIIEHIVGRTRGICDSANQDLECFERIPGILPSSQFEDNPWIQVSFKKTLAVVGIQFTIPVSTDSARDFEDIYVRVGDKYVLEKSDLSGNPICGNFRGPPKPDQTHIVKNGRGVLQIKDIVVLLVPESNIKETTHIGGFLIEALFCDDEALLTCERSGAGVILTVDAYAGQTLDNGVCNPQNSIVDIKTSDCERSHKSIVKNNCEGQRKCMIDLTGTETCPIETKYRRILYRCTNFERPIGRASSVESKDHAPQFALDGKNFDMKGVYIVKALEIVFGDIINIQRSIELNVLNSPYVPEDSDSLNNDYDGFFRNDRLVSNQTSFRGPRRSSLCAYIDLIPDPTYVYIHCNRKVAGKYVVLIVKEFTVLVLQEIVILLAGDSAL
ncbi:unnamed protein product [Lepeophtheirus salmonis]|uniref:(salmon louse) hypothetical protein n=1 Tax=Lepeophtheirus salmonis TaxID=72036 RepID=A0A7R8CS13_LEPSM|nr:unnamed protein product [Lepeophtheirus salmonis]CAF2912532.1 unnamed protein product [Lepeophtheirus salmonis]